MDGVESQCTQSSRDHSEVLRQEMKMGITRQDRGSGDGLLALYVNPWNVWGNVAGNAHVSPLAATGPD